MDLSFLPSIPVAVRPVRAFLALLLCGVLLAACSSSERGAHSSRSAAGEAPPAWTIEDTQEWTAWAAATEHLHLSEGRAIPTDSAARFRSILKQYGRKRNPERLLLEQVPLWNEWRPVTGVQPKGGGDAPVFLPTGTDDYWYLNAERGGGVYGAWYSTDMKTWTHHPKVIGKNWVTTAEYADGAFYVYYDEPNDQDPHLVIDEDLTDSVHQAKGEVFADPSHGSDAGVLRTEDGSFHLFYEDWSPLHAPRHEWDSPLAGHTSSTDGTGGFEPHEHPAPIDERTAPLPESESYDHVSGEDLFYHEHKEPQDAYGDFTLIQVGGQYYTFCDYNPHDGPMRTGIWTSDSLGTQFRWGGEIGEGFHPDPTVGFAEGRFYLLVQDTKYDYVSSGPWAGRVEARVGVDEEGDGAVDRWTSWSVVEETYARKPGFSRIVNRTPAALDLSSLPPGYGFRVEIRTDAGAGAGSVFRLTTGDRIDYQYQTDYDSKPVLDRIRLSFE